MLGGDVRQDLPDRAVPVLSPMPFIQVYYAGGFRRPRVPLGG